VTMKKISHLLILFSVILILISSIGCSYLKKRGNDALDIFDIGISVTDKWEPDFSIYINPFEIAPIGYSRIDGKFLGIGNRQVGWLDHEHRAWGAVVWGSEKAGSGEFNPNDPHQVRDDQSNLKERPKFNVGIVRMTKKNNVPPLLQFFQCDKCVHLGWIGVRANCRLADLIDFIIGWTTIDILDDDNIPSQERSNVKK